MGTSACFYLELRPSLPAVHNYPSPGSGFLSVGHAGGKVVLYKLHHYQNA
uniref:Uncharacterized protein n=1 Tax=Setaria italica TaxID=4555 RepID=K3ZZ99_SETIT